MCLCQFTFAEAILQKALHEMKQTVQRAPPSQCFHLKAALIFEPINLKCMFSSKLSILSAMASI